MPENQKVSGDLVIFRLCSFYWSVCTAEADDLALSQCVPEPGVGVLAHQHSEPPQAAEICLVREISRVFYQDTVLYSPLRVYIHLSSMGPPVTCSLRPIHKTEKLAEQPKDKAPLVLPSTIGASDVLSLALECRRGEDVLQPHMWTSDDVGRNSLLF